MFPPGAIIASRYRVLSEIGRGGMGAVYLVEHLHTGAKHALKALHGHLLNRGNAIERFRREARVAAILKSEHVAAVTDADVATGHGGVPFLVMDLLEGLDVEALAQQQQRLQPALVAAIVAQCARAIAKAHAAGIVHRDLKPENLFYHHPPDGPPLIKVLDFGIAKAFADGQTDPQLSQTPLTRTGGMIGTPIYMAPEQAVGEDVYPQTDVWAIGMIAFRLLVGEPYWMGLDRTRLIAALISPLPHPPSTRAPWLPAGFDAWFAQSCAPDPEARFGGVTEQAAALAQALGLFPQMVQQPLQAVTHARPVLPTDPTALPSGSSPPPGWSPSQAAAPTRQSSHGSQVTPAPIAVITPAPRPRRSGSGRGWLIAAGVAAIMVMAGGVAALTVSLVSGASSAEEEEAPPTGEPYVVTSRVLGGPPALEELAIRQVVESHFDELLGCYDEALNRDPYLEGDLTLMLSLNSQGQVNTGITALKGIPDKPLRSCCLAYAKSWPFPPPQGRSIGSFQYTVTFGRAKR